MIGAIHVYTLSQENPGASPTLEGRVVREEPITTQVVGRVDEVSTREALLAAQRGQTHDIVCQAPLETVVNDRMTVIVTDPEALAGTYRIGSVRLSKSRLRLFCSRYTVKDA